MKIKIYKLIPIVAWLVIIAIYSGCRDEGLSSDKGNICSGVVQTWDKDGDGISDNVEINNRDEGYHPDLDPDSCNVDPSSAVGTYNSGSLTGALNLPDKGTKSEYTHDYVGDSCCDTDDWGTLDLLNCIEAVAREWIFTVYSVNILDLSLPNGGPFPGHTSHQNGLDVDIRYIRKDNDNIALNIFTNPQDYDTCRTKILIEDIITNCKVVNIFVDINSVGFSNILFKDATGHEDHFHVRIVDNY